MANTTVWNIHKKYSLCHNLGIDKPRVKTSQRIISSATLLFGLKVAMHSLRLLPFLGNCFCLSVFL